MSAFDAWNAAQIIGDTDHERSDLRGELDDEIRAGARDVLGIEADEESDERLEYCIECGRVTTWWYGWFSRQCLECRTREEYGPAHA